MVFQTKQEKIQWYSDMTILIDKQKQQLVKKQSINSKFIYLFNILRN